MALKFSSIKSPKTKAQNKEPSLSRGQVTRAEGKENVVSDTRRQIILLVIKIAFVVALVYIVFFVIFGVTRMSDYSMYPSVRDGDLLVYYRMENNFNNGDIVVVEKDGETQVFRIIASPGQVVNIDTEDNSLSVDSQPSTYEAFYETPRAEKTIFKYPYTVSPDCYFMLNDYRSNTSDSRAYGEFCKKDIKGRLITKIQVRDF